MQRGPGRDTILRASREERRAHGRARRDRVPRSAQGRWAAPSRRDDPVSTLKRASVGRIPALVSLKTWRMSASPFAFFRGAAPVMAQDLAALPVSGLPVQICGDAHVRNLGAFAAPDGHLVFDVNDFDETTVGPWEWDVKRLATSLVLAGREAGTGKPRVRDAVATFVRTYRDGLEQLSDLRLLDLLRVEVRRGDAPQLLRSVFAKAERVTNASTLDKLTVVRRGRPPVFHDRPPILYHVPEAAARAVVRSLEPYRETLSPDRRLALDVYRPVDVAFKVVGTGSVGTRDFVVLLLGRGPEDPLFLQVKEELPSCYAPYLRAAAHVEHEGRRVAEGQHRMQSATDPLLGWTTIAGRQYIVRQLADHRAALEPGDLVDDALTAYAVVCGEVLAKAHARTGDAAAISGYCGRGGALDEAVTQFALAYADQTESDHARLRAAIRAGEIESASELRLHRAWSHLGRQDLDGLRANRRRRAKVLNEKSAGTPGVPSARARTRTGWRSS
jgi:uncharacterized protein (DUF2252 family)